MLGCKESLKTPSVLKTAGKNVGPPSSKYQQYVPRQEIVLVSAASRMEHGIKSPSIVKKLVKEPITLEEMRVRHNIRLGSHSASKQRRLGSPLMVHSGVSRITNIVEGEPNSNFGGC